MSSAADKPEHVRALSVSLSSFFALVAFIFSQRHLLNTAQKMEQLSLISQQMMERTSTTIDKRSGGWSQRITL